MMERTTLRVLVGAAILVLALSAIYVFWGTPASQGQKENAARAVVVEFGSHLQQVSLLAPNASSTIASAYGAYVTPELLTQWEANPSQAPGRLTSSPLPDHIEIVSTTPQGAGFIIQAAVVLMTSSEVEHGGNAGFIPVIMQVIPQGGGWRIASYTEQATSTVSR